MFKCSKEQMKSILNYCEHKLKCISDNPKYNGFIVFLFHLLFYIVTTYFLFFYPISPIFYFVIVIWGIILASNFYFRGCILTKLERQLWNTNTWYGPYYMFCDFENLSDNKIINIYICQKILIISLLFVRILFR